MVEKIRILIADDVAETRENVQRLLLFEEDLEVVGLTGDGERAVAMAEELRPDIILMDINMPGLDGIAATELLSLRLPETAVVIMSVQGEQEYLRQAMIAGAREYLVKPFSSDELVATLRRVHRLSQKRQISIQARQAFLKNDRKRGRVITVFSTKGGVGRTTVAANLAVGMVTANSRRVAVVDLDLQFGDVAITLNLVPRRTIADLAQEFPEDSTALERYLCTHSSGVKVLAAPAKPEYAELVTAAQVKQVLELFREDYDYIFVDTPATFQDHVLTALDASDQVLLLATLDLPTVKNVKLCLDTMRGLRYDQEKVRLVLNKLAGERYLRTRDVEAALDHQVDANLPLDEVTSVSALNKGVPLILEYPNSRLAGALRNLTRTLAAGGRAKGHVQRKSMLASLF
jgi:pilus assembly protein CpaE